MLFWAAIILAPDTAEAYVSTFRDAGDGAIRGSRRRTDSHFATPLTTLPIPQANAAGGLLFQIGLNTKPNDAYWLESAINRNYEGVCPGLQQTSAAGTDLFFWRDD